MLSRALTTALFDELGKIAAVSLSGLSPQTVLNQKKPGIMQTPGYTKASETLGKAGMMKSALSTPAMTLRASQKVGKIGQNINKGPGIKQQIRGSLIGRVGSLPPI